MIGLTFQTLIAAWDTGVTSFNCKTNDDSITAMIVMNKEKNHLKLILSQRIRLSRKAFDYVAKF